MGIQISEATVKKFAIEKTIPDRTSLFILIGILELKAQIKNIPAPITHNMG